jgi:HEAT repeat protein
MRMGRLGILVMLGAALGFGQQTKPPDVGQAKPPDTKQRCRTILDDAVQDKNPNTRRDGAQAMSLLGVKDEALKYLAPMLDDHDVPVRIAVVNTLADFKDPRTIPHLKKALQDPIPEVDFAAAKVLYQLHDPEGVQFLMEVIAKENKATSNYFSKEKRGALRLLHTPTQLFTTIAIEAAGFAPVPGLGFGLSSANGILSNPDSSARAASLLVIGNSNDPALADTVESALTDKEWSLRAAAVHTVAMHPFPQYREQLVPLLEDDKVAVRVRAAAAYIRLQPRQPKATPRKRISGTHKPSAAPPTQPNHS